MSRESPELVESGSALPAGGLVHRVARPDGQPPHPAVVMIHGKSGNEDVMWIFERTIPSDYLVVAPRAIKNDPDGGYSWRIRSADEWPALTQFDDAVARLMRFLGALPELYGADEDRVYLMGFSQGAALAFAAAMRYPGRIKGVAGLVGFVPIGGEDVLRTRPLNGLPVFVAAGKRDERIPYGRTQESVQTLRAAGAELEYHEYDTGHKLNAAGMRALKAWWERR